MSELHSVKPCINVFADRERRLRGYFGDPLGNFEDRELTPTEILAAIKGINDVNLRLSVNESGGE